jgi:hypothetical protein
MLSYNGEIWLPNIKCIKEYIDQYKYLLETYYTIELINDVNRNPLVRATENVNILLQKDNPNPFINSNQLSRLDVNFPFYQLKFNK